ncbi:glycosidase [Mucilaginibacter pallidiroseus]|uniref:Glycosidase n=1 Tax=Mucilaginibacter pallidiroseus TaxID=2599295 RepID=A0A563UIB0_9SPHI|nr:glycoside hydrolase family 130 protein [Mucilaginibacter pallidiroseus]TWR31112.1 glycosidase [Mucilaginibacter pallidiroseus]
MADIAKRFPQNPLLSPKDLKPTVDGLQIACLLNPGAFKFEGKTWLLLRVAERPAQSEIHVSFPILTETGKTQIMEIALNDADLIATDARVVRYKGVDYLTTLSHLRLLCSEDGVNFHEPEGYQKLFGKGPLQTFGIEDCRVTKLEDKFYLTFTAVSDSGVGVGMRTTTDFKTFENHGMILPPHNKDVAIFEEKINGKYYALHRPSSVDIGGNYIWLAESPDGLHWGNHKCIMKTREGYWDSGRVGAGAAPIKTEKGWLEIYHGATKEHRYCLGAALLDLNDPSKVLARSVEPIMEPIAPYEITGFFGHVVFTNGHVLEDDGDTITIYYGAADEHVCGAHLSIREIFASLGV